MLENNMFLLPQEKHILVKVMQFLDEMKMETLIHDSYHLGYRFLTQSDGW